MEDRGEEDPKEAARLERKSPEVEKLLRQFVTDGPKGNSKKFKDNLEAALANKCENCNGFGKTGEGYVRTEICACCKGSGKISPRGDLVRGEQGASESKVEG